jgi:hypothetical protein
MAIFTRGVMHLHNYDFDLENAVRAFPFTVKTRCDAVGAYDYVLSGVANTPFLFGLYDWNLNLVKNSQLYYLKVGAEPSWAKFSYNYAGTGKDAPKIEPNRTYYAAVQSADMGGTTIHTGDTAAAGNYLYRYDSVYTGTLPSSVSPWTSTLNGYTLNLQVFLKTKGRIVMLGIGGDTMMMHGGMELDTTI